MRFRNSGKIFIIFVFVITAGLGLARKAESPHTNSELPTGNSTNSSLEDFYNSAKSLAPESLRAETTFNAVGDIMLSREVAGKIDAADDATLPFKKMEGLLRAADFNFGNLESPITSSLQYHNQNQFIFNAPAAFTEGLTIYNFAALNLANNHANDQEALGLKFTRSFLDKHNIDHVGTGDSLLEAWQGKVIEENGIKVGFVGATYGLNYGPLDKTQFVARLKDTQNLRNSIETLAATSDFIVVTMHAGEEYSRKPNADQTAFAHAAIDYGADMVIGAHPHWIQPIEKYKDKYIFYSLGNFIFDQEWSKETKEGLVATITLEGFRQSSRTIPNAARSDAIQGTKQKALLTKINLIPIVIENYSTPRPANPDESKSILQKINQPDTLLFP